MNDNLRFGILIAVFVLVAGVLWFALSRDEPVPEETAARPVERVREEPEPVSEVALPPLESPRPAIQRDRANSPAKAAKPADSADQRRGLGSIRGRLLPSEAVPAPGAVVRLHFAGVRPRENTEANTFFAEAASGEDGSFEFQRLPLGYYVLLTSGDGFRGNAETTLTRRRPERNVDIPIYRRTAVSGRVLDTSGAGISGATVYLSAYYARGRRVSVSHAWARAVTAHSLSGPDGAYVVDDINLRDNQLIEFEITASAEGYAIKTMPKTGGGTRNWDIVLSAGGSVSGEVVQIESGAPLPHARLRIASKTVLGSIDLETDDAGRFHVTELSVGEHRIQVIDDELVASADTAKFTIDEGLETSGIRIEVALGGSISGRLYDADTGRGISGAAIMARPQGFEFEFDNRQETGPEGYYEFSGLLDGGYMVSRDYNVYGYPRPRGGGGGDEKTVSVRLGEETAGIDFALSQGLVLSGTVIDTEGRPVGQASINARNRTGSEYQSGESRSDGSFAVAGLNAGVEYHVSARKAGLAGAPVGPFTIPEEGLHDVEIVLGAGGSIEGVVVEVNGNPAPGIRVYASDEGALSGSSSPPADVQGRFKISDLPAGTYGFQLSDPGGSSFRPSLTPNPKVEVAAAEAVTGVRLVYDTKSGLSISGRVTNTKGEPIPRVLMQAQGQGWASSQTNAEGRYELAGLLEGVYEIRTQVFSYSNATESGIPAGSTNVDFILRGRGTVEGQVLDAMTRQPIEDFSVMQFKAGTQFQPHMNQNFRTFHDPEGRFTLTDVEEGGAVILARAQGYARGETTVSGVDQDRPVRDVTVLLESAALVEGIVTNVQGEPIASAMIFEGQVPQWYEMAALTRTLRDGTFSLDALSPNTTLISARHGEYAPGSTAVDLESGRSIQIEIVLTRGGVVEGVVTHAGEALSNQWVGINYISSSGGWYNTNTQTGSDGAYRMAGLPEGTAMVNSGFPLEGGSSRNRSVKVEVENDKVTVADIDFPYATASIEGVVYLDEATPLAANVSATIEAEGGQERAFFQAGADGRFVLDGLPAGSLTLEVYLQGYPSRRFTFDIEDGQQMHRDVVIGGGGTVEVTLLNLPSDNGQATAMALPGSHDIPSRFTAESFGQLQTHMAVAAQVSGETATLSGLEPGTYTIFVFFFSQADMEELGRDPSMVEEVYSRMPLASTVVTIEEENQRLNVTLSF